MNPLLEAKPLGERPLQARPLETPHPQPIALRGDYGSLSWAAIKRFRDALRDVAREENPTVAVDMTEVKMIGAAFLGVLASHWGRVALFGLNPFCREVLQIVGFDWAIDDASPN